MLNDMPVVPLLMAELLDQCLFLYIFLSKYNGISHSHPQRRPQASSGRESFFVIS